MVHAARDDGPKNVVVLFEGLGEPIHSQLARRSPGASKAETRMAPRRADRSNEKQPSSQPMASSQVQAIVRDYLLENPHIIREALDPSRHLRSQALALRDELVRAEDVPVAGDLSGAVTVVVFFDYGCAFCKRSLAAVRAMASEVGVRLQLRDYPILGEQSVAAAQLALAAGMQGRYLDAHYALMERNEGFENIRLAEDLGKTLGVDSQRLRIDMASSEVAAVIDANRALGQRLGVTGTPAFLVLGPQLVQVAIGALEEAQLRDLVESVQ